MDDTAIQPYAKDPATSRYSPQSAAPFIGLSLVRLFRFPRKDTTANYQRDHGSNKNSKLHLLRHGVLRRLKHHKPLLDRATRASIVP
jgi:hypothetical protein